MSIVFKKLRYKNFLSVGNDFTEIDFLKNSTTLLVGKNGSGKSTFIDALVFGLYGKAYRKINKPQLVNSINCKNLVVEIEFSTGNIDYMIRRGIKPGIFDIFMDGNQLPQLANVRDSQEHLEQNILKIGYRAFNQIVVLGSAQHVPFMQLPPQTRREMIEDLLDIQIFSIMNTVLKERVSMFKEEYAKNEAELKLIDSKIDMTMKHVESMKQNQQSYINEQEAKIIKLKAVFLENKRLRRENIDKYSKEAEKLAAFDTMDLEKKMMSLLKIKASLDTDLRTANKEIKFYEKNQDCPTCQQEINDTFRESKTSALQKKVAHVNSKKKILQEKYKELQALLDQLKDAQNICRDLTNQSIVISNKIEDNKIRRAEVKADIDKRKNEASIKTNDETSLKSFALEKANLKDTKRTLLEQKDLLTSAAVLLKDGGIKAKIIKQYIPIMNKLIAKYLAAMDFYIQFELDENFTEKILSRYRDEFTYESFSEGEKFRIDLSLLFTWRAVAKLRNSSSCNLLILDEIFDSSLDSSGTDEFLKIMETLTADTNVFIISHRLDTMTDKFDHVIKFSKDKNFSTISGAS